MDGGLVFRKISSIEPVVDYLSKAISLHLKKGEKVLWLVPGGSSIKIAVEAAKKLVPDNLQNLAVILTDERYGPVGNADSNWRHLSDAGFSLNGAELIPVLDGSDLESSVARYNKVIMDAFKEADYAIAQIGFGPDGHIAGIKPRSPAVASNDMVVGYEWDDFTRLAPTAKALEKLDEAIVYMTGKEKWLQIDKLDKDLSDNEQPAQILKRLERVIVFNDYKDSE